MTNREFAAKLEAIAAIYKTHESIKQFPVTIFADTKDQMRDIIKTVGGRWIKSERNYGSEHRVIFTHVATGLDEEESELLEVSG